MIKLLLDIESYFYDIWMNTIEKYPCLVDICNKYEWRYDTINLNINSSAISRRRYILSYQKLTSQQIKTIINNSRFKKFLNDKRKKN